MPSKSKRTPHNDNRAQDTLPIQLALGHVCAFRLSRLRADRCLPASFSCLLGWQLRKFSEVSLTFNAVVASGREACMRTRLLRVLRCPPFTQAGEASWNIIRNDMLCLGKVLGNLLLPSSTRRLPSAPGRFASPLRPKDKLPATLIALSTQAKDHTLVPATRTGRGNSRRRTVSISQF
jgi:hypothetical protein